MTADCFTSRRNFLKNSLLGGPAAIAAWRLPSARAAQAASTDSGTAASKFTSRVALTTGNDRANLAFTALQPFRKEIAAAIGEKRVIVKPNCVVPNSPLVVTHADNLEGILEFLKSVGKTNVIIAESPGEGAALDSFAGYGYNKFVGKYGVKLVDIDKEAYQFDFCIDEKDGQPHARRVSKLVYDPNNFIISTALMKTHILAGVTLSLKNVIISSGIKDPGSTFWPNSPAGVTTDKPIAHGGGTHGINYNLYSLSEKIHPHLAVIDGYVGIEGDGPLLDLKNMGAVAGALQAAPVDHRVCVASLDWLAADCVATTLMGIDVSDIGYLTYSIRARRGEGDLSKIEIVGPPIKDHVKQYKRPRNWSEVTSWRQPLTPAKPAA